MDSLPYQILESPQPVARSRHILGSVVPSNLRATPFDNYAPYFANPNWKEKERKELEGHSNEFWQSPQNDSVSSNNVMNFQKFTERDDGRTKLLQILNPYFSKMLAKCVKVKSGNVEEFTIDNPGGALQHRLSKCNLWMSELQDLYKRDDRRKPQYCIITGVYTCKDTSVSLDKSRNSKKGLEAKVPSNAMTAAVTSGADAVVPGNPGKELDMDMSFDHTREQERKDAQHLEEHIIFAVRYHMLKYQTNEDQKGKASPERPRMWVRLTNKFTSRQQTSKSKIESVWSGDPIRNGSNMIGTHDGDGNGGHEGEDDTPNFFWEEPVYSRPDEEGAENNAEPNDNAR